MESDDEPDFGLDEFDDDEPDFGLDEFDDDGPEFGLDVVEDDGADFELDVVDLDGPAFDCLPNSSSKNANPLKQNSSIKSIEKANGDGGESGKHTDANNYVIFKDVLNKNPSLVAGLYNNPRTKNTSEVQKLLRALSSIESDEDKLTEIMFQQIKYVGFRPSKIDDEFSKIKEGNQLSIKAFLIYLFLTRGSNIDLIKNTSDKRTSEKLTKLQKMYNLKSKVLDGGPSTLTLSRIATTYPTIVASMLHKFDESKVKRPVKKSMLKKICGADFPSVLMSNIVASLIPKDAKVIRRDDSQKIRNAIALYTALEAQKTKRSFSEKSLQECLHLNAKYVTMAYNSDFVKEKQRQSAFKKPYFKDVYHNGKLSQQVVRIDIFMQKVIDDIKKNDPFFKI